MLNLTDINLTGLATHFVGNKAIGDELQLADREVNIRNEEHRNQLLQFFLAPFTEQGAYNLWHPSDLRQNDVYRLAGHFFKYYTLLGTSQLLARELHSRMDLPNISSGELHVCSFEVSGIAALGIYRTRNRENFVQLHEMSAGYQFEFKEGLCIEQAALIYNVGAEQGYKLYILDKGKHPGFWMDNFLRVRQAADDFHRTANVLKITKDFIKEQVPSEFEVTSVEQIDLLNKSAAWFKRNEQFNKEQFVNEVFAQPELIASFNKYQQQYSEDYEVEVPDQFDINSKAVKKQAARMKSVIKLDKNFHVYVHGDKDLIEKGYDAAQGMNFYKIYFEEEK